MTKHSGGSSRDDKSKPLQDRKFGQHIHQLEDHDPEERQAELSSDDSICHLQSTNSKAQYFAEVEVAALNSGKSAQVKFQLDTEATCSTMSLEDYSRISNQAPQQSQAKLKLYDNSIIHPIGSVKLHLTANGIKKKIHFEVIRDAPTSLLSGKACEALGLLRFNEECAMHVTTATPSLTKEQILHEYKDIFTGLGKLPGTYHIETDPTVKPVQNNPRRVPIPVKAELKNKIEELENMGVIARVTQPTEWISNMVAVRKQNKLRVCLDPLELNKAVLRNHYPIPTVEQIVPRLSKAKVFSTVDAKDGFLQVVLDEPSSYLTTFWTPYGRYRWLRMLFGIKSAPEEFQRRIDECLEGLENIQTIHDDVIIFGTGDSEEEVLASHDKACRALLDRCRERGLKLNKKKIKFKQDSVAYMGHIFGKQGLSPDPVKVQVVRDMPRPTDIQGVQRLVGVVTYLSKFMLQLSSICEPLRRLTDKTAVFDWLPQHEEALTTIKNLITQAPVLHHYDVDKEVTLECDSSDVGLGAVLSQDGHPVAYASQALTHTERNFAEIEKECLAVVFATERFEHYILGREKIRVFSDTSP